MISSGVLGLFWLVLVPYIIGRLFQVTEKRVFYTNSLFYGYVMMFAVFECISLPLIFMRKSLALCTVLFCASLLLLSGISLFKNRHGITAFNYKKIKSLVQLHWTTWIGIILVITQTIISTLFMHIDQDDSFYVGTATTAVYTDTLFEYSPYTGYRYESLPSRYVLSPFPIFTAVLSKLIMLHPTILAHTVFPAVFIPLSYMVVWMIGKEFFPQNKKGQGTFFLLVAIIQMTSFYSVYTQGTFLLLRIWQGKSILANIILPGLFLLCIRMMGSKGKCGINWFLIFLLSISAALVSSMGIMLAPIMIGIFGIISGITERRWNIVFKYVLCCCFSLICGLIYIMIR